MKKPLLSLTLVLLTFSINGCLKREMIATPQQEVIQETIPSYGTSVEMQPIEEIPPRELPIIENPATIEVIPQEVIPQRETSTPPASTAGASHQLRTVQGGTIAIQERSNGFVFPQYNNKIVLLQIFGKECEYCLKEMPMLAQVQQQYAGNLQIIALQAQDPMSPATASMLIQQHQMYYPVIDKEEAGDLLYFLQQTYGWTGILPYTLLIKNGVTQFSFFGEVSPQELNEAIQSLL